MAYSRSGGNGILAFLAGMGLGAGLMALLDPAAGGKRRSYIRQKSEHFISVVRRRGPAQLRHLRNTVVGGMAEQGARMRDEQISDDIVAERVRAQLGHVVSHLGALDVRVHDGHVIINGPVLHGERQKIADRLAETRGIRGYQLQVSEQAPTESIPGLQGGAAAS